MIRNFKEAYFKEKIDNIINKDYKTNDTLLERLVRLSPKDGLILEFGVFSGVTVNRISTVTNKTVYGFDSFEGLPEDWGRGMNKGFFKCDLPEVNSNVELVVGWFNETLEGFLEKHDEKIAFCHVDCDLYSSTKYVLNTLKNKFQSGTNLLFDELANFPDYEDHEYKAFLEFLSDENNDYDIEFLGRRGVESYGFKLV
jgi:Macrocin-O-methyltransferase (TylF)